MPGGRRAPRALPQAVLLAVLAALVGYPLLSVVTGAAGAGPLVFTRLLFAPGAARAWGNTLWVSAVASVLALLIAAGAVAATAGVRGGLAMAIRGGVVLPLLVPPFASAVGWSQAYGPGGMTDAVFHLPLRAVVGPAGVVLATAAEVMPIAFLVLAASATIKGDPAAVMAARASGSNRWDAYLRVTVPLMRPAAAAALTLTFLASANNFTVPAVLGTPAGFETLTSRIYDDLNFATTPSAFVEARVLAASLALVTILILLPAARLVGAGADTMAAAPRGGGRRRGTKLALAGVGAYLVVAAIGPLVALVLTALTRAPGLPPSPANWSLVNFQQAVSDNRFVPALGNSLFLALLAASLLVVLGLAVTTVERQRGGSAIASGVSLGFAVPGSVVAVAFLLTYGRWIGGSLLIILLAYAAKLWAVAHRPVSGALQGIPAELRMAARSSGAGGPDTLRTIIAPILAPALAVAWVLVFLFAFHEVTMSSLLYGPASQTLAVMVLNVEQVGDAGTTAALACALTLAVVVPAIALAALLRRRTGGRN